MNQTPTLKLASTLRRWGNKLYQWEQNRQIEANRRRFLRNRSDPWISEPGTYTTRQGTTVTVEPNFEGWLDGLPWIVTGHMGGQYTVDSRGYVFPEHGENKGDIVR